MVFYLENIEFLLITSIPRNIIWIMSLLCKILFKRDLIETFNNQATDYRFVNL